MVETRNYKIGKRIFTLSDITKIALVFEREFKNSDKKGHRSSLKFSVKCKDDSKYETESVGLFDEKTINTKKVEDIEFYFVDYKEEKRIQLNLKNGNYSFGNELKISGTDSNWVNGCLIKLKEIIEGAKPQLDLINKFSLPLTLLFSVSIGMLFLLILTTTGRSVTGKSFISPFKLINDEPRIFLTSILVIGYFPAGSIIEWLKKIFPDVEIQIGPQHTFIEKNRRKILFAVIALILLQIILPLLIK